MSLLEPTSTNGWIASFLFFGLISYFFYSIVLHRPSSQVPARATAGTHATLPGMQEDEAANQHQQRHTALYPPNSSTISAVTRLPPHMHPPSAALAPITATSSQGSSNGFQWLADGLVAFRYTKAAVVPALSSTDTTDRARILSRLLDQVRQDRATSSSTTSTTTAAAGSTIAPPPKGSVWVVSIPASHVSCDLTRRVIALLATWYSLLLVLVLDETIQSKELGNDSTSTNTESQSHDGKEFRQKCLDTLRQDRSSSNEAQDKVHLQSDRSDPPSLSCAEGDSVDENDPSESNDKPSEDEHDASLSKDTRPVHPVTEDMLPRHRILWATTSTGRVALVRQLQQPRVALVVDSDASVQTELHRFGYTVVLLPSMDKNNANATNTLGEVLLK
jgi:hypothetical protein